MGVSEENKRIIVELFTDEDELCIKISNNFSNTINIEKIYDKGYTTKTNGHGYGLSLVKEITDKNKKLTKNNYANLMFYQSDFMTVASFDSILNGVDELITNKNASGNSVPGFQLPSSIYDFKNIVNDLNNLELNPTNVFAKNDFCKNINILGKIHTRLDIDILGNIKESNQLSVDEVSQLAIVCDVYNRLIDSDNKSGSILFQPITFADKKTHFLVEILTNNLSNIIWHKSNYIRKINVKFSIFCLK